MHNKPYTNWRYIMKGWLFLVIAIVGEVIATSALKSSEALLSLPFRRGHNRLWHRILFSFSGSEIHPVGVAYAVWSGLGVVIIQPCLVVSWAKA
ncbi:hypothetical protein GS448_25445 [Rhodococcus hoagii]|nr:hypothetical protein [Prescottella equi]